MTDATDSCQPPAPLARAIAAFRQHAFAALLNDTDPPRIAQVAEAASRDATGVAPAITWLESHGQLERDGDHLIGAHGLTRRSSPHSFTIGDRSLHTWCAYDALAIPVVLGIDTRAATTCPTCGQPLVVDIADGQLPSEPAPRLWLPTGPCDDVMADFCTKANLFCSPDHLDAWRAASGDPPGTPATLADLPTLALHDWADIATSLAQPASDPASRGAS